MNNFLNHQRRLAVQSAILTRLIVSHEIVGNEIHASGHIDLRKRDLDAAGQLPDLRDVVLSGDYYCYNLHLASLVGAPKKVTGEFNCSDNDLTSLAGGPKVARDFFCQNNQLSDLQHGPKVHRIYACHGNPLASFTGLKPSDDEEGAWLLRCDPGTLTSLAGFHAVRRFKKFDVEMKTLQEPVDLEKFLDIIKKLPAMAFRQERLVAAEARQQERRAAFLRAAVHGSGKIKPAKRLQFQRPTPAV